MRAQPPALSDGDVLSIVASTYAMLDPPRVDGFLWRHICLLLVLLELPSAAMAALSRFPA